MPAFSDPAVRAKAAATRAANAAKKEDVNANPITDDGPIQVAAPVRRGRPPKEKENHREQLEPEQSDRIAPVIIGSLEELDLDELTYQETGELLNALSAASTKIAVARRLKQEQLEAGTHRAKCQTCGRWIDISKPGGFQILTMRDEHHMPQNVYFCSQVCLLSQNMPSHREQERIKKQKEGKA